MEKEELQTKWWLKEKKATFTFETFKRFFLAMLFMLFEVRVNIIKCQKCSCAVYRDIRSEEL